MNKPFFYLVRKVGKDELKIFQMIIKRLGYHAIGKHRPDFIAAYDSATAMLTSLSNCLKGKDFKGTGTIPPSELLASAVDILPAAWKEKLYSASGPLDAVMPQQIKDIDVAAFDQWVTRNYPEKNYPAIAIGASNGAMVHLCAALGIPWLPQTFLIPVQKPRIHKDLPKRSMDWAFPYGEELLKNNPHIQLHHMTDPNQDRLHLDYITYFRVKKTRLDRIYEKFIREKLMPGGKILVIDCQYTWSTVRLSDRQVFQFGGSGGLKPDEYYTAGNRVIDFLRKEKSPYYTWDAPEPDSKSPEAEWGFASGLLKDVKAFASDNHFKVQHITFDDPHDPSPMVADLYREWYRQRGLPANQLLIECFALHEPYWTLKTGTVPYWMVFNTEDSANAVENYLQSAAPFDNIYMMLLSHGADSLGLVPIHRWKNMLNYAKKNGQFLGMVPGKYPRDFGVYMRYNKAIRKHIPSRYSTLAPMQMSFVRKFMDEHADKYKVRWSMDSTESKSSQKMNPVSSEPVHA